MRTVLHTLVFTVCIIELLHIIEFSLDIMNTTEQEKQES